MIGANRVGWSAEETLAKLLASVILLSLFVAVELLQDRPMVDFALFRRRTFLGASFAMLGFAAAAQVMMTYLPLYLQNVFALSPAAAGLGIAAGSSRCRCFCARGSPRLFRRACRAAIS